MLNWLLLWLHVSHVITWYFHWQWMFVNLHTQKHYDLYCGEEYFNGYHSPNCSANTMTECHDDSHCTLYYNYRDGSYDNDQDDCRDQDDCSRCKCVAEYFYESITMAFMFFLALNMLMEIGRFIGIMHILCDDKNEDNPDAIGMLSDGIQFRLLQILNPLKYNYAVNYQYKKGLFFNIIQHYFIADFFVHQIPFHVLAFVLLSHGADINTSWFNGIETVYISITLFGINQILKLGYKVKYKCNNSCKTSEYDNLNSYLDIHMNNKTKTPQFPDTDKMEGHQTPQNDPLLKDKIHQNSINYCHTNN